MLNSVTLLLPNQMPQKTLIGSFCFMSHNQKHEGSLAFTSVNSFRQFSLINDEDTTVLSTRQNQGGKKKLKISITL